jgi:hypothetical protein
MARESVIKHTLRLNMDNKQQAAIHEVIMGLDPNIHKSHNNFIVNALDFYIENVGKDFPNASGIRYITKEEMEGIKKEITAHAASEAKSEVIRLLMGAVFGPGQPAPTVWPPAKQGGATETAETAEDDEVVMENALKWFNAE